jgi:CRP-like cAMP-binding protein
MATPAPRRVEEGDDPVGPLLLKLRRRDAVSAREAQVLRDAVEAVGELPADHVMVEAGAAPGACTLLLEGLVVRTKALNGDLRQITDIHVPGDFVDLHGYLLKRLEHRIASLTPVRFARVPHAALTRITESEPHLARLLWLGTLIDAAVQRERILSIGRRTALARVAHFMCELFVRLDVVGLAEQEGFSLPITQIDIADATGLTSVHVNRMLRQLRDRSLLTFRGGNAVIHDWPGLQALADFDPDYLFLTPEPR